ncbi:hypothetical protein AWB73_05775 [Caballeronia turbans]|nr:hypothetical protein AWB73_05775 [Caballeronia turbans]
MPYIESLGEHWGTLCVTPALASDWADRLLPLVTHVLEAKRFNYSVGVVPCLSALYAAGRFEEIVKLVPRDRLSSWWYRRWAVDALVCLGRPGDALRLAEASRGLNAPEGAIARAPDGQLKLPQFWSRKIPHRVKQDEVEFYSSFVFCARASAASLRR